MTISGREIRQVVLLTFVVLILPMVIFPELFGTELVSMSLLSLLIEVVFYGAVLLAFNRHQTLIQLLQAAGICLVYRLAIGAIFGLLIAAAYSLNLGIALTLAVSSYLPAVLLQVAATPFILYPVMREIIATRRRSRPQRIERPAAAMTKTVDTGAAPGEETAVSSGKRTSRTTPPAERRVKSPTEYEPITLRPKKYSHRSTAAQGVHELSGFEKAVNYIGEHGSVKLAAVVDPEGLMLGRFVRGDVEADEWAPYAVILCQKNEELLGRTELEQPEKVDLFLSDQRLTVARSADCYLIVLAERQSDDLLGIRVSQAVEMIRKYIGERYSEDMFVNAESIHV